MLTNEEFVTVMPGLANIASNPHPYLYNLISGADAAIKDYLKRDIEQKSYVQYLSGDTNRGLIIRQYPVLSSQTTIASGVTG